jgi:arylsulfatase A-like enzyme
VTSRTLAAIAVLAAVSCAEPRRAGGTATTPAAAATTPTAAPAAACAVDAASDPAAKGQGMSLLAALADGRLAVEGGDDAAAAEGVSLLVDDFEVPTGESKLPPQYLSGAGLLALERGDASDPQRGLAAVRDPSVGTVAAIDPAAAALVRDVRADGAAAIRVRIRARRAGAGAPGRAGLSLETLDRFVDDRPPQVARNRKLALPPIKRADTVRESLLQPGDDWQELEIVASPRADRAGLRVAIHADACGLLVDRLEITKLSGAARLLSGPRDPDDPATQAAARRVRLGDDVIDCLVLRGRARASVDVDVPALRPRLELSVAGLGDGRPPRCSIRADGKRLDAIDGAGRLTPITLPLDEFAGRRVKLELVASGAPGDAILLGDPRILGASATPPGQSLLLISIDTLRADRVGCYGDPATSNTHASLTPRIDELARGGTRFARATAASTWTLPSHGALFTGQFPAVHGAVDLFHRVDARRSPTLALELQRAGFQTAAFTGGVVVDPAFGFGAGFARYSVRDPGVATTSGIDPLEPALGWLARRADQRFFLFVHTYRAHDYKPSREALERVAPGRADELLATSRNELIEKTKRGDAEAAAKLRLLYDATVAQADTEVVGRLLDELAKLGLSERALVCVLSDHGEEFLEHGGALHGEAITAELDRVPWIVRGPGIQSGRVVDSPVSHVDVMPTLLGRLGLDAPPTSQGIDVLRGEPESDRALLVQLERPAATWDALVGDAWKLVRRRTKDATEQRLFRLDVDPKETEDVAAAQPQVVERLARRLDHELAGLAAFARALDAARAGESTIDPKLLEDLKRLGYVDDSR